MSPQDAKDGEELYLSPDSREAVEIAARVVALLNTKSSSIAVDSAQIEADEYDGSVSVSEWLHRATESPG